MKSIQETKKMMEEQERIYNEIVNLKNLEDYVQYEKDEQRIIAGTWVDILDDLLDYNMQEFLEKNGYDTEDIDKKFSVSDENVQKEIFITEDQAKEMLEHKEKFCQEHPYGTIANKYFGGGLYVQKIELDVLKWFLEIA